MQEYRARDPQVVSRNMSAIRSIGGKAEVALRSELHRRGLRFRKNVHRLPGRPDVVFPRAKLVVFVDGDYWHARILREQGIEALRERMRTSNKEYWIQKFQRRLEIDDRVTAHLKAEGWTVLRMWESDVRADVRSAAAQIESGLGRW